MATVIVRQCDRHLMADEVVEGHQIILGISGRWQAVDLCQTCHDEMLGALIELYAEKGVTVDGPASKGVRPRTLARPVLPGMPGAGEDAGSNSYMCPWCPATYHVSNRLTEHTTQVHGVGAPDIRKSIFDGYNCPLCGDPYKTLGNHTATKHGGLTSAQAFRLAAEQGDPHGVVRDLLGKAQSQPGGLVVAEVS